MGSTPRDIKALAEEFHAKRFENLGALCLDKFPNEKQELDSEIDHQLTSLNFPPAAQKNRLTAELPQINFEELDKNDASTQAETKGTCEQEGKRLSGNIPTGDIEEG